MQLSEILKGKRSGLVAERDALLKDATPESFTPEVEARANDLTKTLTELDANIESALESEKREAAAAVTRVEVKSEANPVYRKDNADHSYFRDLFTANTQGDVQARERLINAQVRDTSGIVAASNTFAPPLWLVEDFVAYARPARVAANIVNQETLPAGVSSINLPAISTGASTAVQATENTGVSKTDLVVTSVSSGITTIAGQQVVSLQLLKQSGIPFDRVILSDLARAYAAALDSQVLNGTNANGQLNGLKNGTAVTYTSSAPVVVSATNADSFMYQIRKAITAIETSRYEAPDAIIMHPRRWGWVMNANDTTNRPLVVPNGMFYNSPGTSDAVAAAGMVGTLQGIPVYVDANIVTNLGTGTNQDQVFVLRAADSWLYETPLEAASFEATYANQASILFRVLGFSAFLQRYSASTQVIGGTGLVSP